MSITLKWLADQLGGEFSGDPSLEIHRVVHPSHATSQHDLALAYSESVRPIMEAGGIETALVPLGIDVLGVPNLLRVKRPRVALSLLLALFDCPPEVDDGIAPSAVVDETATVAASAVVGPGCVIGARASIGERCRLVAGVHVGADVEIGEDGVIFAGVVIGDRVQIGKRVRIKANAAIGNDGFSFQTEEPGSAEVVIGTGEIRPTESETLRIASVGTVVVEDDVEIGACTCIDRATLHETRISAGTKIDNLVQIGHNVQIGKKCLIIAQAGIAGSTTLGDRVVMAGQAGIVDHITVGDDVVIMPQTGIISDIQPRICVGGTPAQPRLDMLHDMVRVRRLKELLERVDDLEARLKAHEQF